jgi:MraZ protein
MGNPAIVYVVPNLSGKKCLEVFQPEAFAERLEELNRLSLTDADAGEFVTMIGRVSETLDVDVQGRIRIGDALLDHIGVVRDVTIIGAMNRLQIWAAGGEPTFGEAFSKVVPAAKAVHF